MDIDRWYATQFAYLLGKLDAVKEGNGTMLDNTLVVWGREMGTTSHKMQPVNLYPGGRRARGAADRAVPRPQPRAAREGAGVDCRLMGLADVTGVGDINANSGPLAGIG